jgi:hypothetical protein
MCVCRVGGCDCVDVACVFLDSSNEESLLQA